MSPAPRKTLRVGIAGYGVVGKRRHQFMETNPHFELVAVCDRSLQEGSVINDFKVHHDYRALLQEDLDVLFVCMSNDMASQVTVAALRRGLHVFCEKPPARTLGEFAEVVREARQHPHLKLKYGFNHRYHDSVRDALRLMRGGELGRVLSMNGVYGKSKMVDFHTDWRCQRELAGGGILLDQGIHMVDLMRLFAGDFESVNSHISSSFWNFDVEDNAYAFMRSSSGVVAYLHSSATQWRHKFHLDMTFEKGTVILSGILSGTKSYGAETITVAFTDPAAPGDPKEQTTRYNQDNSWKDEIDEFAACIVEDRPVENGSADEALKTLHLVYRIYCADPTWRQRFGLSDAIPEI